MPMWNGSEELTESRQHNPPLLMINIMGLWLVDYQRGGNALIQIYGMQPQSHNGFALEGK